MIKILKFESDSCPQCKALSPILEKVKKNFKTEVEIEVVNIEEDESQELMRRYNIRSLPTMIFLKEGQEYNRLLGNQPYSNIINIINS